MAARALLFCGLAAPAVFIVADLAIGSSWRGYDFTGRSINELSAIGSPVRGTAAPLFALVNVLTVAFGAGLLSVAGGNTRVQIVAGVVIANGVLALAAALFPSQAGLTPRFFSPGVLFAAASVFCIVIAIAAGAVAFGGWLRVYSIATLGAYALLTIVGYASHMQPRIGLQERLMAYTWMVWLGLVAAALLVARLRGVTVSS